MPAGTLLLKSLRAGLTCPPKLGEGGRLHHTNMKGRYFIYHRNTTLPEQDQLLRYLPMPYPEFFVAPMREELTSLGVQELRTPA